MHFNSTFCVQEGQRAAVVGYPIFRGLNVGPEGVALKCFTGNVQNEDDESFLKTMESDVFQSGLKLATTLQPAIGPLSQIAFGLTRAFATRHRNVAVQEFYLGLDFTNLPARARLAEGDYIAVQVPESLSERWRCEDSLYDPEGRIVKKDDPSQLIQYNYVILGVSRYTEAAPV